jgi:hypothetical protein
VHQVKPEENPTLRIAPSLAEDAERLPLLLARLLVNVDHLATAALR